MISFYNKGKIICEYVHVSISHYGTTNLTRARKHGTGVLSRAPIDIEVIFQNSIYFLFN